MPSRLTRDHDDAVPRSRPVPAAPGAGPTRALALQRSAGNRATSQLIAAVVAEPAADRSWRAQTLTVQRELVAVPSSAPGGKVTVLSLPRQMGGGQRLLFRDTETNKLYARSEQSKPTRLVLYEVRQTADGGPYEYCVPLVKREEAVRLRTKQDWSQIATISGSFMLHPARTYPHVTVELTSSPVEDSDPVHFTKFHYSRSRDDTDRCGYVITADGCRVDGHPPDRKDRADECHNEADRFLAAAGFPFRVSR